MDLDVEHTFPLPMPSKEYLVAARRSLQHDFLPYPRLSKQRKGSLHINLDYYCEKKPTEDFQPCKEPPSSPVGVFQNGKYIKDPNAPKDKNHFVLITIALFGLVHMLPFLFFMTANEYWMYKFRNVTHESSDANDRTYLQRYFSSLNSVTITTPGVICNFIAGIAGHKILATTRIFCVLAVHSTVLTLQAVFVMVNTDTWQVGFFVFVLLCQLMMSCAMSLGGSGSMGLVAKLPPLYLKAKLLGEGGAGVFSAVLRLASIMVTPSTEGAALMYFGIGSVLMIINMIVFYFATKTKFFRYYTQSAEEDVKENLRNFSDFLEVFKIIWPLILLNLFGMLVPISSLTNLVVSEYYGTSSIWGTKYFVTICTYLIPAITGLCGRALFNGMDYDMSLPVLYLLSLSKEIIFGVLFFLTNAKPRYHLPVIINRDWEYGILTGAQSFLSGFFMNLNMVKSMRMVPPNRIELGMMVTMFFMSVFAAATSPLGVLAVSLL
ncbi:equilibrative nucleoside transporter 3-like [Anthonomus grandis grandis]|uniref:equilibrative nucleoside transporter 3-like n=1 Tax=Anthonomus grandis grandis TaxID=2921223 RepID=UPI002166BE62|nr:equilibrative nucleoside transporter 3-like [Anthonomus grandis grandis]